MQLKSPKSLVSRREIFLPFFACKMMDGGRLRQWGRMEGLVWCLPTTSNPVSLARRVMSGG